MIKLFYWCIPMKRDKMRKILARELYGDMVGDIYAVLSDKQRLFYDAMGFRNSDDVRVNMYIDRYYPNPQYPPYMEAE